MIGRFRDGGAVSAPAWRTRQSRLAASLFVAVGGDRNDIRPLNFCSVKNRYGQGDEKSWGPDPPQCPSVETAATKSSSTA